MKHNKGFAPVQTLLVLVTVAIIGGVGFFVYKTQKDTNKALDNAKNAVDEPVKIEARTDVKEEDSWLLYTPTNKAYSVRIPDGWEILEHNNNLYNFNVNTMEYKKGTKATAKVDNDGGWDGTLPFSLYNPGLYYDEIVREGAQASDIKTDAGLTVHKYTFTQTLEPEGIGYTQGAMVYNYYFDKEGKYLQITHVVNPGDADQHELVERLIKTITVK